jgi:hypothetical protein
VPGTLIPTGTVPANLDEIKFFPPGGLVAETIESVRLIDAETQRSIPIVATQAGYISVRPYEGFAENTTYVLTATNACSGARWAAAFRSELVRPIPIALGTLSARVDAVFIEEQDPDDIGPCGGRIVENEYARVVLTLDFDETARPWRHLLGLHVRSNHEPRRTASQPAVGRAEAVFECTPATHTLHLEGFLPGWGYAFGATDPVEVEVDCPSCTCATSAQQTLPWLIVVAVPLIVRRRPC